MKKIIFLFFALLLLLMPVSISAANNQPEETVYVFGEDETFNGNLIKGAFKIELNGKVNGDVFIGANEVVINGEINGSLFAGAMSITIGEKAKITGNSYLGASLINLDGKTEGNVYAFSSSFDMGKTATASQDVYAFGGAVIMEGKVGRDFRSSTGTADIMGEVGRDVQMYDVEQLKITDSAKIGGSLTYRSANDATIDQDAQLNRSTITKQAPVVTKEKQKKESAGAWVASAVYGFFAILLVALLIVLLMPNKSKVIVNSISGNFWMNLLAGLVVLLVVPLACIILMFTLIGIPISILTLIFYGIVIYVSRIFVGIIAGVFLMNKMAPKMKEKPKYILAALLGTAIIYILTLIPILGGIIGFLTALLVFGAIWHERKSMDNIAVAPATKK